MNWPNWPKVPMVIILTIAVVVGLWWLPSAYFFQVPDLVLTDETPAMFAEGKRQFRLQIENTQNQSFFDVRVVFPDLEPHEMVQVGNTNDWIYDTEECTDSYSYHFRVKIAIIDGAFYKTQFLRGPDLQDLVVRSGVGTVVWSGQGKSEVLVRSVVGVSQLSSHRLKLSNANPNTTVTFRNYTNDILTVEQLDVPNPSLNPPNFTSSLSDGRVVPFDLNCGSAVSITVTWAPQPNVTEASADLYFDSHKKGDTGISYRVLIPIDGSRN